MRLPEIEPLYGIPVRVGRYLPEGTMMPIGAHGERPEDWDAMDEWARAQWALAHGATMFISPDVWLNLRKEVTDDGWRT